MLKLLNPKEYISTSSVTLVDVKTKRLEVKIVLIRFLSLIHSDRLEIHTKNGRPIALFLFVEYVRFFEQFGR